MTSEQEGELERLMVQAQQGDRGAYEDLLTRVAGLVQAYARDRSTRAADVRPR